MVGWSRPGATRVAVTRRLIVEAGPHEQPPAAPQQRIRECRIRIGARHHDATLQRRRAAGVSRIDAEEEPDAERRSPHTGFRGAAGEPLEIEAALGLYPGAPVAV